MGAKTSSHPDGIRYSLTLHSPNGARILGYDNRHGIPGDKADVPFDHVHKDRKIAKYSYKNAAQLLDDFFADVTIKIESEREINYEYEI